MPGEDGEGHEAPEGEPPAREGEATGQGTGAATGGAEPLDGGVPGEAGAETGPPREEEPVPGLSGLSHSFLVYIFRVI